jgi:hypothetical protein
MILLLARTLALKQNQRVEVERLFCFSDGVDQRRSRRTFFWLSDEAGSAIEPHLLNNQPSARRVDDRRVISGIRHVLLPLVRLSDRLWSLHDGLRPMQSLVAPKLLAQALDALSTPAR